MIAQGGRRRKVRTDAPAGPKGLIAPLGTIPSRAHPRRRLTPTSPVRKAEHTSLSLSGEEVLRVKNGVH